MLFGSSVGMFTYLIRDSGKPVKISKTPHLNSISRTDIAMQVTSVCMLILVYSKFTRFPVKDSAKHFHESICLSITRQNKGIKMFLITTHSMGFCFDKIQYKVPKNQY